MGRKKTHFSNFHSTSLTRLDLFFNMKNSIMGFTRKAYLINFMYKLLSSKSPKDYGDEYNFLYHKLYKVLYPFLFLLNQSYY